MRGKSGVTTLPVGSAFGTLRGMEIDAAGIWPYHLNMAVSTVKSTYSLDVESVRALEALARKWKVPKSEVLRRAIRIAATDEELGDRAKLAALDRLQTSVRERRTDISQWARDLRAERRATGRRLPSNPE